ncbi:Rhamnulose-1-phosphate aldolase [termite gut metagenome]|uniref:Rhamnulose-1-phosphate aldolase n=1 Tax=termite gut metagenome TaxID=433724 RepID=A0A5J4R968_9ZZZZ
MAFIINSELKKQLEEIAEVAGYLWEKGWAERNAGNISINISDIIGEDNKNLPALSGYALPRNMSVLAGDFFYVTGTGKRMRDVAKNPLEQGSIVRVSADGNSYDIIAKKDIKPTSELPSHFSIHVSFKEKGSKNKLVLHTHPTDLIALSHIPELKSSEAINQLLWGMHPETFIVVPRGIGLVPYEVPGTLNLADASLKLLDKHDIIIWKKHGVLAVGENLSDTFDLIDTLSKSAQIYAFAKTCGHIPEGLTKEQIEGLIVPFGIVL